MISSRLDLDFVCNKVIVHVLHCKSSIKFNLYLILSLTGSQCSLNINCVIQQKRVELHISLDAIFCNR